MGLAMILSLAWAHAQALPKGGQYVAGSGSIASSGSAMTITQSSARGIINWQGFSIGGTNSVHFNNGSGATLNQVLGGNLSAIEGELTATGSVYLINPNGIVVGPSGKVITGGSFIGSTLTVSNQRFMEGGALDFSGSLAGTVVNDGKIASQNGNITLMGNSVTNAGNLFAPQGTVALAAGNQVLLKPLNGPAGIYIAPAASGNATNSGRIKAATAAVESAGGNVYELAGNQSGLINATGSQTVNGQVWLTAPAGRVNVSGTVEAQNANGSGGTIMAKGQSVALSAGSSLDAAGLTGGGQIETSGESVSLGGKVSAGQGGTWTIDPTDLTIDSTAATTIDGDLGSGNVTLQTTASGASGPGTQNASGVGDININSAISWSANTTLTLDAYHGVTINSPITSTGSSAGLTIKTNDGGSGGNFTVNSPISLANSASLAINGNAYTLTNSETGLEDMSSSGYIALNSDITLDSSYSVYSSFGGTLEGLGHTVSGLSINNSSGSSLGLFNTITGTVENLNVSGNITAESEAGILAFDNHGTVYNVLTSGSITAQGTFGGLVGRNEGSITASSSSATLTIAPNTYMAGDIGGLIGYNNGGTVTSSSATGSVDGGAAENLDSVGGLIGDNAGPVTNSYSTENITLGQYVYSTGGLIGYDNGNVTGSYSTGSITLGNYNWYTGGLIGEEFEATISDSYSTGSINAGTHSYYTGGFLGQADYSSTIETSYSTGAVTASGEYIGGFLGGTTGGGGFGYPTFTSDYWNEDRSGTTTGAGSGSTSGVTGLSASGSSPFSASSYAGFNFTTTPGATGNNWVIVDTDGTLNGSNGGTMPMLASEYSTTINNAHQLQLVAMAPSASYTVGTDINASATGSSTSAATGTDGWGPSGFIPVGEITAFTGTFNGLGNTISNLTINTSVTNAGMFGQIGSGGVVENIGLVGGSVTNGASNSYVGRLAGDNDGTITNAYATGAVTGVNGNYVGGLVGFNQSTITDAHATGAAGGGSDSVVGGLVGYNNGGTIADSYATGALTAGIDSYVGGLAGFSNGTITNAYATGAATGGTDNYAGGLVGFNDGTISGVYATGAVSGGIEIGGLVGFNLHPITDSYWDTATTGTTSGVGFGSASGTTGLTTAKWLTQGPIATGTWNTSTWVTGYPYPVLKALPYVLVTGSGTQTYGSSTPSVSISSSADQNGNDATGLVNTSGLSWITNAGVTSNVGSYALGGTGATVSTGYQITYNGTLTVNPATLTAGLTGTVSKTYDSTTAATLAPANYTLSGIIGSDNVTLNDPTTGVYASKNAGTGIGVTVSGLALGGSAAGNYTLGSTSASANIGTITPASLTAGLTGTVSKTYDGTTAATLTPGNYTLSGVIGSDQVTLNNPASGAYASQNAGTGIGVAVSGLALSGASAGNYTLASTSINANIGTITPAALTITASNANKTYGSAASLSGFTTSGLVNGDSVSGVTLASTGAAATANAGNYSITANSATGSGLSNYTITYDNGVLTVNPAALTITATNASKTYGSAASLSGFTTSGLVNGDSVSGVTLASTGAAATANAGNYSITANSATGSGLSNYTITYDNGVLTVNPAALTAGLTGTVSKTYDGNTTAALAPGNYTLSGILNGDQVTLNDPTAGNYAGQNAGTGIAVTASGLTLGGSAAGNYTLASTTASGNIGTITPASLTAGLTGTVSKTYDGTTAATLAPANYMLSGVIGSDQVTLNDPTSGVYATAETGTGIPVTVTGLSLFGSDASDYTLASTSITGNVGVIKTVVSPQATLLPFITTLPTPVPASGAGSLVLVGASNGFGPIPLILLPSNTVETTVTADGVAFSTGISLTVDPEQTLNQTGGVRHLNVNLPPASGSGSLGGQQ
ncbi:MAG TPA: YDG domain-containing protein [Terriglobia bacterium]|nr:YDG domain-containing protein [Terriglobia bacterium]